MVAIPPESGKPDAALPQLSPRGSGARPRSQSNWVVGLAVGAIVGAILVGVAAIVFLAGSISISNPFEDTDPVESTAPAVTIATTTLGPAADDYYGLLVGDCIDDEELNSYVAGDDYETTSCDDPHGNEVYLVYEFARGPYPGEDAAREGLVSVCEGEFEGYVGRAYESSSLDVYAIWPGADLWASGVRIGECLLYDRDLNQLTGSAYQSGW